ncbi:hypothetical protein FKP32DRAFT_1620586 [Trametes sanguinea]|nr:hypothetical protein FKP32DRAFT_1620586 [Trametes sanguinea]
MVSSFGALRALLVAALLSPALSLPHPPAALPWKRNIQNYVDNMVYLDGSKSSLYCAVEANRQTYGGYLDNHWDGMIVKSDSSQGSTSQITVESVSVTVSSNHGTIAFMGEDVEIDYYTTSQWPSQWPAIDSSAGVGSARIGIDITNSKSVMNQYLAKKWSNILDNWYYDLFIFYDWMNTTAPKTEIDFAGIMTTGTVFDWNAVLDIAPSDIKSWGLPDMSTIKNQPYIYLRNDGTFYIDDCLWVNGKQYTEKSRVSGASSGSVVVDIHLTERWSYFPDDIVKALYGSVSGSKYYSQSNYGYYQIPCDTKITFWFTIGGVKYTVIEEALIAPNPWGDQCIGSIFTYGKSSSWDITFGFQFLSSFYYRSGVSHSSNQPYAKLLPLPSPAQGSYGSSSDAWSWTKSGNGITYSDSGSNSNSGSGYSGSGYSGSSGSSGSSYSESSGSGYSGSGGSGYQGSSGSSQSWGYQGGSYQSSSAYAASSTYGSGSGSGGYNGWGSNNGYNNDYQSSSSSTYQAASTYGSGSGSGSGWGNNNGGYNGYQSSSTSASYPSSTYGSGSGSGSGWNNGNNYNSGSNYQSSQGGWGNGGYQSQYTPSTTTTFTTVTHTNIGTTTVAWPTSGSGSGYSGSGYSGSGSNSGSGYSGSGYSGSGSEQDSDSYSYSYGYSYSDSESSSYSTAVSGYQGSHYSGSGSGYSGSGYANEDLKVAGNAAVDETDENGNDLNLPHGSITDKLKHCLPAIIVVAALAGLGLVIGLITCLVRSRRNRDAPRGSSAYSTVHFKDVHEPVSVPLYGAEEGSSRYSDPYKDKE